jgi:acetaldehyde dehydrogenase (acetylating)
MTINVAVLGSGNIGIDLVERLLREPEFCVKYFIGRRSDSPGLQRFEGTEIQLLSEGTASLTKIITEVDGVFDATSAFDHPQHWEIVKSSEKWIIDLTPAKLGVPITPILVNKVPSMKIAPGTSANYSMVTCGGQSSALLLYAIATGTKGISEVEISSSIAALSAGLATRRNIDQYVETTENLGRILTGSNIVKSILVLNPAEPPVMMRTTVHIKAEKIDLDKINESLNVGVLELQNFVPGFHITVFPTLISKEIVTVTAKVTGAGYYLPAYAGNLDIINAAAVETAKLHMLVKAGK